MKFNESTLKAYAAPLSDTEDLKCKRAIEAIRDALKDLGYTDDQKPIVPITMGNSLKTLVFLELLVYNGDETINLEESQ